MNPFILLPTFQDPGGRIAQQPQVQIPAPSRFFSVRTFLFTAYFVNSMEIEPIYVVLWISQMQLAFKSRARYYQKFLQDPNHLFLFI